MQVSTCWTEQLGIYGTLEFCRDLAVEHCDAGGPACREVRDAIFANDYSKLCNYNIDYAQPFSAESFEHLRQALGYYSKLADLDIGIDKELAAFDTWLQTERSCKSVNDMMRAYNRGLFSFRPSVNTAIRSARQMVQRVLGRCPSIDDLMVSFGPGATSSIKKKDASPQRKLAEKPCCSTNLLASGLLPSVCRTAPAWFFEHAVAVDYEKDGWICDLVEFDIDEGKLEFVPKSAKTYRTIDKQPTVNTFLQRGIGKCMSKRLLHAGLDLQDQAINRRLALSGSLDGSLATIDLSNASDTIATELVRYLLPSDWFRLLNAARTGSTSYKSNQIVLEKFSSQGNGFTFPLESLIFWALVSSVCEHSNVSVYGDDIICPSERFHDVIEVLNACGFYANKGKSYSTGPFRESCGGDYYEGINIRPYYLKRSLSGQTLFSLHNFYIRKGRKPFADIVKTYIPKPLRLYGPDGYGDGHLISDLYPVVSRRKERNKGWEGSYFKTYRISGNKHISVYPGDHVTPLYVSYVRDDRDPLKYLDNGTCGLHFSRDGRPCYDLPNCDGDGYEEVLIYKFGG